MLANCTKFVHKYYWSSVIKKVWLEKFFVHEYCQYYAFHKDYWSSVIKKGGLDKFFVHEFCPCYAY